MRQNWVLGTGLLLSAVASAAWPVAAVQAQAVSVSARREIAARYTRYDRLDAGKDTQSFLLWYLENTTGDYTERQYGGHVATRDQVLGAIRSLAAQTRNRPSGVNLRSATVIQKLARSGASAVASTKVTVVAKTPPAKGRAAATVATVETHRDTWVPSAGHWRLKRREVLTHATTVNGKPAH